MGVEAVTLDGPKPYSDMPVVVGPVQDGFSAALGTAVAASSTGAPAGLPPSASGATLPTSTFGALPTPQFGSVAGMPVSSSRSGPVNTSSYRTVNGALTTTTGRSLLTLGQMVGAGVASGATSPLGVASISRPGMGAAAIMTPMSPITTSSSGYQPPEALTPFGNGRIPLEMLTPIGIGGHRLYAPAAQAFMSMRAAAAAEGIDIGITDSYRTYEQQVDLAARKGLYSEGGYAAVPGTSKHGWGMAIDIDVDDAGQAWMRANAGRFGFVENVPREPWHWEFIAPTA
jgi:D-alanyl-D-alanine carboxypeptidase